MAECPECAALRNEVINAALIAAYEEYERQTGETVGGLQRHRERLAKQGGGESGG